jgi:hypothetical protein
METTRGAPRIDDRAGSPSAARMVLAAVVLAVVLVPGITAQQAPSIASDAAVPAARFAGTWVGTQAWAIKNPPPGASQDQAVTLVLEVVDGKITGTMTPFLGGEDGATIVDATIVGDELRATAVAGRPRAQAAGRRGGGGGGWKDPIRIAFVFKNAGVQMTGTADVRMGDVPWMTFAYDLGKKRARY